LEIKIAGAWEGQVHLNEMDGVDKKFQKELQAGITALVLLSVLNRSGEPMYGYQIAKLIGEAREEFSSQQGVLYPALRSLENNGMLQSLVEPSVSGPPRRYYTITAAGRETLERWQEIWRQTVTYVEAIMEGKAK
jgi:PadR family transcriptional regulator, regulatory protein PadR